MPAIVDAAQNQQGVKGLVTSLETSGEQGVGTQDQQRIHEPVTGTEEPADGVPSPELRKETVRSRVQELEDKKEEAQTRRSRVSIAVQEMERVATNNQGIGDQVRVIAQNQNKIQEEAEGALENAQKRSSFARFFIGPNYKELKAVEDRLENHAQNIAELKELKEQIKDSPDVTLLDDQIQTIEGIREELRNEVANEKKGFSLFGWIPRLFSR